MRLIIHTLFFCFVLVPLHGQTYILNKELSKQKIASIDTLNDLDKTMMSMSIDMAEMYLLIEDDSVEMFFDGLSPSFNKESLDSFKEHCVIKPNSIVVENTYIFQEDSNPKISKKIQELKKQLSLKKKMKEALVSEPLIVFEQRTINFDTVSVGDTVQATFRFKNLSSQYVTIYEVKTSCGCTTTSWPKYKIKPQAQDSIVVNLDPKKAYNGFSTKRIVVRHSLLKEPVYLYLRGEIVNPNKVAPSTRDALTKKLLGDTITLNELYKKQAEFDESLDNLNQINELLNGANTTKVYKYEDFMTIDTLGKNKFVLKIDWSKYLQSLNEIRGN